MSSVSMTFDRPTAASLALGDPVACDVMDRLTDALIGEAQVDMLSHRAVLALVPLLADAGVLDVRRDDAVSRFYGIRGQPQDEQEIRDRLRALVTETSDAHSIAHAVLSDGRLVLRGEMAVTGRASYSLVVVPVCAPDGRVMASLGLVTFGLHDRYGRATMPLVEAVASRIGKGLAMAHGMERAVHGHLTARSHLEVLQDTLRSMDRSIEELRERVRTLELENAALRTYSAAVPLAASSAA